MSDLPEAETADPDAVQVALRAAHTLWSRGDTTESLQWLRRAAESASDEGADMRSLQLAKAAAELRAKLFGSPDARPSVHSITQGANAQGATAQGAAAWPVFEGGGTSNESGAHLAASPEQTELAGPVSSHPPASSSLAGDSGRGAWAEESAPAPGSVRPVVTATQYPSHRPRQLMGLSPTNLETAVQRDGATYSAVPSWSADSERRISSAPPPLPRAAIDDYEELEAEPDDDDAAEHAASGWASKPPPLPARSEFADEEDDVMRPEQPTVAIPPPDETGELTPTFDASARRPANGKSSGRAPSAATSWDSAVRAPSWQPEASSSWDFDGRGSSWGSDSGPGGSEPSASDSTAPKLTARVHHQAVRVSFTPDPHAPGQYVVRPLREGERPLPGERVALLVALEPGQPLV